MRQIRLHECSLLHNIYGYLISTIFSWASPFLMGDSRALGNAEVIIKVIKQGLSGNCLKIYRLLKGEKLLGYCKQHRTTDFRIRFAPLLTLMRDVRENLFNCTRLRIEQHKHGEKTNNNFTDLPFFIRSLLRQTKESENCWEKNGTAVSRTVTSG